jgi:hypothetical protein
MARRASWRLGLRAYLASSLRQDFGTAPLTVGELVDRFADAIPLHAAARKWMAHAPRREKDVELPPAYRMRFYTLTQELHWLGCTFEPLGRKTYDTRVIAHGHVCAHCGEVFVAEKRRPVHGTACAAKKRQ